MKTYFSIIFLLILGTQIIAQTSEKNFFALTKFGNNNWNELNIGFGMVGQKGRTWEFLLGKERRTGLLDRTCYFILKPSHYFYTKTKIKGANLRVTFYPKLENIFGYSLILRYGNAIDQFRRRCGAAPNEPYFSEKYNEEILDIGFTCPIRLFSHRIVSFVISPGCLIRTSKITNYVWRNDDGPTFINEPRMTTRYKILLEWGFTFYLGRKSDPEALLFPSF